jgi:hypothetical protein
MNADFSTPSIANLPPTPENSTIRMQGYFPNPTGAGVGWTFDSSSGVQQNGSQLGAPTAPLPGTQTGYIRNYGTISQSISFPTSGTYKLSFYLAAGLANSNLQFQVSIDGTPIKNIMRASTSFSSPTTVPFSAPQGLHTLSFAGAGQLNALVVQTFFIDQVSITLVPTPPPPPGGTGPQITSAVPAISPVPSDTIMLEGQNFGPPYGKFHIHFPKPSTTPFSTGSFTDLTVDADTSQWFGSGANIIGSLPITTASQTGSVTQQTVDITMTAKDGKTSNVWHALFLEDAWITGGSQTVSPNVAFYLVGWNFGAPGKLTIHFPMKNPSDPSSFDVPVPVSPGEWVGDAMMVYMPPITGVVEQTVDITFTTQNGRKSHPWKAKFIPTMDIEQLTWQDVTVGTCDNNAWDNNCNGNTDTGIGSLFCATNAVGFPSTDSFDGYHTGCCCGDSDNGTDKYSVSVKNGWMIFSLDFSPLNENDPELDNGTVHYSTSPDRILGNTPGQVFFPASTDSLQISVPWHVGGSGGYVNYQGDIWIKGPRGVPYH